MHNPNQLESSEKPDNESNLLSNKNESPTHKPSKKVQMASFDEIDVSHAYNDSLSDIAVGVATDRHKMYGIILAIFSSVGSALMVVFGKIAYIRNPNLNGLDYLLIRTFPMNLLAYGSVRYNKVNMFDIQPGYRIYMFYRGLCTLIGMPGFFIAIKFIPATKGNLITNLHPLIVGLLAYLFMKEPITKSSVFALLGAFIGVVIFSLHQNDKTVATNYYLGILLMTVAMFGIVFIVLVLRKMNQAVHFSLAPLYASLTTTMISIVLLIFKPSLFSFSSYTVTDISLFVISGILNYLSQILKSLALKYETASAIVAYSYLEVVILLLGDLTIFGYSFGITDYAGVSLTVFGLIYPVVVKLISQK